MRIRRKLPKAARHAAPAYVIGYTGSPPSPEEMKAWFDLEYGGPLSLRAPSGPISGSEAPLHAIHGPWQATLQILLAPSDCEAWKDRLSWGHGRAGQVLPAPVVPAKAVDLVLHAARLARGLTLLTQGTAYDLGTRTYLNPSDWSDRPLEQFQAGDHVTVDQGEVGDSWQERFATHGLAKFGLDELEVFRPIGLSSRPAIERLTDVAVEIIRLGRAPAVGTSLSLPVQGVIIQVVRHRTVPSSTGPIPYREITWGDAAVGGFH